MDASVKAKIGKALWLITGATALCVGLGPLCGNVLELLHLDSLDLIIRYLVGIAGLASLVMFFRRCGSCKCK